MSLSGCASPAKEGTQGEGGGGGDRCVVTFKYEKLATFFFVCGHLGHSEQSSEELFSMAKDDGLRGWGLELRVDQRRAGGGAGNRWLREAREGLRNPTQGDGGEGNSNSKVTGGIPEPDSNIPAASLHGDIMISSVIGSGNKGKAAMTERRDLHAYSVAIYGSRVAKMSFNAGPQFTSQYRVGDTQPHGLAGATEAQIEKKRRREGEHSTHVEGLFLEYSVVNNPLVDSSMVDEHGHFL